MPSNLVDNMKWDDLSMAERAKYINLGLDSGVTDLKVIRDTYNKYAEGGPLNPYSAGSLVDAIYKNSKREEYLGKPSHNYDFTISEEEANRLGYYPNERGHRDDRVKKPAHPTHPSRGKWNSFENFELTDKGMENPNYTLFGLNDGEQDPQAAMTYRGGIVLPEITVTPKKNYIHNPYDNINIYAEGGLLDKNENKTNELQNNNSPTSESVAKYVPEGYEPYYGEIRQAPTTSERIVNKVKDVGRAVAAFVPFLGTALDFYDDNMQQAPTGAVGDVADVLNYGSTKIGSKADKITERAIRHKRGSVRRSLLHNANKEVGKSIGRMGPKVARGLGIIGMAIDTPNLVSDIENLKRALGFNYNEGLILK